MLQYNNKKASFLISYLMKVIIQQRTYYNISIACGIQERKKGGNAVKRSKNSDSKKTKVHKNEKKQKHRE